MTPKAAPKATGIAVILALLLVVLGIVCGRDALIEFGAVTADPWIGPAIDTVREITVRTWMFPAGIALGILGLILVVVSVLPRRRTHTLSDSEGVWISRPKRSRVSVVGRAAATADRLGSAVFGILFVTVGTAAVAWQRNQLPTQIHDARRTFESWAPTEWDDQQWWPWALTAATVVTVVIGLRWLYAHRPRRQPALLTTDSDEHASVDLTSAARNVAAEFAATPGIDSATARVIQLRQSRVVRLSGIADDSETPTADLVESATKLRALCATALAGLAVDTQVLITVRQDR